MTPKRIAVIGGGISGLAAAYSLAEARRGGAPVEEYLFEASEHLGGALRTEELGGCLVEAGADSFLTEKPEASELCRELGLGDELIGSNDEQRRTLIVRYGKLLPLPAGLEFFVPRRPWSLFSTALLSPGDKLAVVTEVFQRRRAARGDESVAGFVERHFGRGFVENIVDPLLAGIYGGASEQLSAGAVLPRLVELERTHGSLVRGLWRARAKQEKAPGQPLFTTLGSGLGTLVAALRARLEDTRTMRQRHAAGVTRIASAGGQGLRVLFHIGESFDADAVILAVPAHEAARLLETYDPQLADHLVEIPYSSSLIVALGYDAAVQERLPAAFGFLVPRREPLRMVACTFVANKFPHRVPPDRTLLRCFYGGVRDEAVLELNDQQVVELARRELEEVLGLAARPRFFAVYRWRKALPQYTVGHRERLEAVHHRLTGHRGLFLCGNAYDGIGVSDCIRSGKTAAEACLHEVAAQDRESKVETAF